MRIRGVQQHAHLATAQANELAVNVEQNSRSLGEISFSMGQVALGAKTQEQVVIEADASEVMFQGASQGNECPISCKP
ncbi:hypothetical protein D3C73_610930 [compost metagenome]